VQQPYNNNQPITGYSKTTYYNNNQPITYYNKQSANHWLLQNHILQQQLANHWLQQYHRLQQPTEDYCELFHRTLLDAWLGDWWGAWHVEVVFNFIVPCFF
jgi:hypothetical protein